VFTEQSSAALPQCRTPEDAHVYNRYPPVVLRGPGAAAKRQNGRMAPFGHADASTENGLCAGRVVGVGSVVIIVLCRREPTYPLLSAADVAATAPPPQI